jgi:cytochrome P450/NADPH-cytochrome P450 reductase
VLKETLRVSAPISQFNVEPKEDTIIGGKYSVKKGETITCLIAKSHMDPLVYGDTADQFIPERLLEEKFDKLMNEYPDCWKPFGNGMRGCIGRPFAWQEVVLLMALLFQNFNFVKDDPSYRPQLNQTLTIKLKNFNMRAILREGVTTAELERRLAGAGSPGFADKQKTTGAVPPLAKTAAAVEKGSGKPLNIYYGSNTGTCEALAQRLAADASSHGFSVLVVDPLDAAYQNIPKDRPVVIITPSYEGNPPDNGALFCEWIQNLKGGELEKVEYAVFGCGEFIGPRDTKSCPPSMLDD